MSRIRSRITFADGWQERFEAWGFHRFEDYFNCEDGSLINRNTRRNVVEMRLGIKDRPEIFFMKRFFYPHWKDIFFTWQNFGSICSQAACEWKNANILRSIDVGAYEPIGYGEQTLLGIERRSFFITRRIEGICLTDWLKQHRSDLRSLELEKKISVLGRLFRRIHDAGIRLPDLYVWHVFLLGDTDSDFTDNSFALIDLHRMKIRRKDIDQRTRDLGAFLYSMCEPFFEDRHRRLLTDAYLEGDLSFNRERFLSAVEHRRQTLQRRRSTPEYARQAGSM
jgi:hypothetical protein